MTRRLTEDRGLIVRAAAVALVALSLVGISALVVSTAQESRETARDVRASTTLWNAYQQARHSLSKEWLLTQDFRLTGSPYFRERFSATTEPLSHALTTIAVTGSGHDRTIAISVRDANDDIAVEANRLVALVHAGNAARAERVGHRIDVLYRKAVNRLNQGAAPHEAESTAGLKAAERSEKVIIASAAGIALLAIVVIAATGAAIRFRQRLDAARRVELERLKTAALTDSLTGVKNHRAFHEQLAAALSSHPEEDGPVSLVMIDLDGLKEINDSYGHQAGDEQLKLLAATAASCLSNGDGLYRLGGDEFAVILHGANAPAALATVGRIHEAFSAHASEFELSFAGGVTVAEVGMSKEELARRADVALVEAKRLQQPALLYSPLFERVIHEDPPHLHHVGVLARALARAVDTKDAYTRSHCETVAELCILIALEMGFEPDQLAKLRLAGLLHDVGKIGVPDAILQKPGRLTEAEFETMRAHPVLGAHILAAAERHEEAHWVLCHHERVDGAGYPNRLGKNEIPLEARIISVADAFEAIISERPYRAARSVPEALAELERCAGKQFDPCCVAALGRVLSRKSWPEAPAETIPLRHPLPLGAAAA